MTNSKSLRYPPVSPELLRPFEHKPGKNNVRLSSYAPNGQTITQQAKNYYPTKGKVITPRAPVQVGVRLRLSSVETIRARTGNHHAGMTRKDRPITEISQKSLDAFRRLLSDSPHKFPSMMTFTYGEKYPTDGDICRAHMQAMISAIKYRYGRPVFAGVREFQKRQAPHYHVAMGIDLRQLGEVITLKRRGKNRRRSPSFQTVREEQDWLFEKWQEIISKPNPRYKGESLNWPGLTHKDVQKARKAYYTFNSAVTWEVMRSQDGGKGYLIKELSSLKSYQKTVPENFTNPGRHFFYSLVRKPSAPPDNAPPEAWLEYESRLEQYESDRANYDIRFDDRNAIEFSISEPELRTLLEGVVKWPFVPNDNRPMYKWLWGVAQQLLKALMDHGFEPVHHSLESLRQYAEFRMAHWAKKAQDNWRFWAQDSELRRYIDGIKKSRLIREKIVREIGWEFVFAQEPEIDAESREPAAGFEPTIQKRALIQEFNQFVKNWNSQAIA